MATLRLPGTVLRSSGEWPCTSALGLFTRRYSAGRSKRSPPSNDTVRVFLSLASRSSVGQDSVIVSLMTRLLQRACSVHKPNRTRGRKVEAAHLAGTRGEVVRAQEAHQCLERRTKIVALA